MTFYDPIPNGMSLQDALDVALHLPNRPGRLREEVATANHVFDALREADLDQLQTHRDQVYALLVALPDALSYRLLRLHRAGLHDERPDIDPRQPFWRSLERRREAAHWDAQLAQ